MLRAWIKPLLAAGTAAVVGAYPALADSFAQFVALNQLMDAESAYGIASSHRLLFNAFVSAGEWGLLPDYTHWRWRIGSAKAAPSPTLATEVWGRQLTSPVGVAAGLDKNAQIIEPLMKLGFGFVEIGSVTPRPQPGNPKPRVFRLVEDRAVINRYGFNSDGAESVRKRLITWRMTSTGQSSYGMLGVNLGKNKETENAADDYIRAMLEIGHFGDYLVINISSPNTSGLRSLQGASEMELLITRIQQEKAKHANLKDKPLLVKIAPDLSVTELEDVARISLGTKIDGLVVNNTTVARPSTLKSEHKQETGGLSGLPLKNRSLEVLKEVYRLTDGKIKIISVGGIDSADDVYSRLKAGASLVQLYTAMTFAGPGLVSKINDRLVDLLEKDGVQHISSIIGSDAKRADN